MYTHAHTRSYMTCVSVMRSCAYTCVIHPYVTLGYIYFVLRLHLLFVSSSSPCRPGFLQLRPCALFLLGGTLLATPPRPSARLRYAFSLVSSSLFSLSFSLAHYLGSDSICRTMLFAMWLHAGGPCSLDEMPELRRRVSLQSTTLLGTQSADRAVTPRARASTFADHRVRLVD